jgi:hypothetical protein
LAAGVEPAERCGDGFLPFPAFVDERGLAGAEFPPPGGANGFEP